MKNRRPLLAVLGIAAIIISYLNYSRFNIDIYTAALLSAIGFALVVFDRGILYKEPEIEEKDAPKDDKDKIKTNRFVRDTSFDDDIIDLDEEDDDLLNDESGDVGKEEDSSEATETEAAEKEPSEETKTEAVENKSSDVIDADATDVNSSEEAKEENAEEDSPEAKEETTEESSSEEIKEETTEENSSEVEKTEQQPIKSIWEKLLVDTGIAQFFESLGSIFPLIMLGQVLPSYATKLWNGGFVSFQGVTRTLYIVAIAYIIGFMISRIIGLTGVKGVFVRMPMGNKTFTLFVYGFFYVLTFALIDFNHTYAIGSIPNAGAAVATFANVAMALSVFLFAVNYARLKGRIAANVLLVLAIFSVLTYYHGEELSIYLMFVLPLGTIGLSDRKIAKMSLLVSCLVFMSSFALAMTGIVETTIERSADGFKHAFGYYNSNHTSIHLASIVIFYLYLRKRKNFFALFLDIGVIAAVAYFIRYYAGGRTSVVGLLYILAGTLVYDFFLIIPKKIRDKCRKVLAVLHFLYVEAMLFGIAGVSVWFSYIYDENHEYRFMRYIERFYNTSSFKARLIAAHKGMTEYVPTWFGQHVNEINNYNWQRGDEMFWLDVFYVRLFIKYGIIAFALYLIFTTILNFRLARRGKFYQMYVISALPLIGIAEGLIGDIVYNIFPILSLASISDYEKEEKKDFFSLPFAPIFIAAWVPLFPTMLSCLRTIFYGHAIGTFNALLIVSGVIIAGAFITWSLVMAFARCWNEKKVTSGSVLSIARAGLIAAVVVIAAVSAVSAIKNQNLTRMIQAEELVSNISAHANGKVYVDNIPDAYDQEYCGISKPFFYGDALAFYEDTTVITNDGNDYTAYFSRGFVYSPISDYDAIYTNDQGVIDYLENKGYTFTNYCTYVSHINLGYDAKLNGLSLDADGNIFLSGPEASLTKGPYVGVKSGNYNMTYELYMNPTDYTEDYKVCTLKILGKDGNTVSAVKDIMRSDFDEHGGLTCTIPFYGLGAGTEFLILMEEGQELYVQDMYYVRTSSYDKRVETDARGNVLYEMYIDSDGNPYMQAAGYYAVHYEYDSEDHRILTRYLDADNNPVMITDGYCEYRAVVDKNGYTTEGSYYDTQGNPIVIRYGYFKFERESDKKGRVLSEAFFGLNNEPVLHISGYHRYRRTLDDLGRILREEYYDLDDKLVLLSAGYAGYDREYDADDNIILQTFLGTDLKPVMISSGYATVQREFNDIKKATLEVYYDSDGERVLLPSGYSRVEREYDEVGNTIEERFYGVDDEPVLINNSYWKIVRVFNEKKQNIHEMYYGTDDKILTLSGGYAGADREYDDLGRVIKLIHIDENGKPVMNTSGYSIWRRSYNERNWITREEYYDADDNPIAIGGGRIAEEYGYDERGNRNCYTYFGEGNERIMLSGSYWKDFRVFNEKNQLVHREFYDTEDKLVLTAGGYSSMDYFYDENGTWTSRKYYDLDGNLVTEEKNE